MDDLQAMRVAQAVIDCAGVPLVYFLLRRAGLALALALCGAAIYAVYPLLAFGSIFLLAEFMSPVLMLGASRCRALRRSRAAVPGALRRRPASTSAWPRLSGPT